MEKKMYFCTQIIKMMIDATTKPIVKLAVLDTVLVAAACLIPAASHLFAVPLYVLNPMLALLLAGVILGRDWRNALMLAVLMPLVSSLLTGMPAAPKMVCMMAELVTVAGLFHLLSRRWNAVVSVFAILAGKVVYYALKAVVIAPAVLVGTEWWMQLLAVALWGGLFVVIYKRMR